jgi:hypothetical protein
VSIELVPDNRPVAALVKASRQANSADEYTVADGKDLPFGDAVRVGDGLQCPDCTWRMYLRVERDPTRDETGWCGFYLVGSSLSRQGVFCRTKAKTERFGSFDELSKLIVDAVNAGRGIVMPYACAGDDGATWSVGAMASGCLFVRVCRILKRFRLTTSISRRRRCKKQL